MWNGQEALQDNKNLGIKLGAFRNVWTPVNWQDVPPHVTRAVEGAGALFEGIGATPVEVGKMRRAAHSYHLLEKWNEGS